jgi:hypothetical protein
MPTLSNSSANANANVTNATITSSQAHAPSIQTTNSSTTGQLLIQSQVSLLSNINNKSASQASITSMPSIADSLPKSVYDSLAPLNPPSNPIVYKDEVNAKTLENSISKSSIELDSRQDEKAKLDSILFTSMNESSGGTFSGSSIGSIHHKMDGHGHLGRFGSTSTMSTGSGWPRPPGVNRSVPSNYTCPICKKPGHTKNMCPDAVKLGGKLGAFKYPHGIPKSFLLLANKDNKFAMQNTSGSFVVPEIELQVSQIVKKDNSIQFLTEEEEEEKQRQKKLGNGDQMGSKGSTQLLKFPKELKCPFGEHIIKDAVLVPCCGHFICCDECIREKIYNDEHVECPYEECDQEIGPLESITPYHQMRKLVNDFLNDAKLTNQRAAVAAAAQQSATGASIANPLGNNLAAAKSNDVFFDLLLTDVENSSTASPINKSSTVFSAPPITIDGSISKGGSASPPSENIIDAENAEKENSNSDELIIRVDGEEGEINKCSKEPWSSPSSNSSSKSPLQDSKISSSVANLSNNSQQQHQQQTNATPSAAPISESQQQALLPTPPLLDRPNGIITQPIPPGAAVASNLRPSNFPTAASELSAANAYSMNIIKYNTVRHAAPPPTLINQGPLVQSGGVPGPTYPIQIGAGIGGSTGFNQQKMRNIVPPTIGNAGQPLQRASSGFIPPATSAPIRPGLMIPPPIHQPSMQQSQPPAFVNPNVPYVGNQMVPGQPGANFGQQGAHVYPQVPPISNQMGSMYQPTPMGMNPRNPLVSQSQFNGPPMQPYGISAATATNQMLNGPSTMGNGSQASLLGMPPSSIMPPQGGTLGQPPSLASGHHIYDSRIPVAVNTLTTAGTPMPLNPIIGSAAGVINAPPSLINPPPIQQPPSIQHTASLLPKMGIMSEEEFYNYKERLKKEAEMQQQQGGYSSRKNRPRKRSASRSISGSYSRSASHSRSRSRSPSRSRSRRRYSPTSAPLKNSSSSHHHHYRHNRSYSRSRSRSRSPRSRSYSSRSRSRSRSRSYYSKSRSPSISRTVGSGSGATSRRQRRRSGSDSRAKMRTYNDKQRSQKSHTYAATTAISNAVLAATSSNVASSDLIPSTEQRIKSDRHGKESKKDRYSEKKTNKSYAQETTALGVMTKPTSLDVVASVIATTQNQPSPKLENELEQTSPKLNAIKPKDDKQHMKDEKRQAEPSKESSTSKKYSSSEKKNHKEKTRDKDRSKGESTKDKESDKDRERKRIKEHRHEGSSSKRSGLLGENVLITIDSSNGRHVSSTADSDVSAKKKKAQTNGSSVPGDTLDSVIVAKVESQAAAAIAAMREGSNIGSNGLTSTNTKDAKEKKDSKESKKHKHKHKKKHKHKHRSSSKH